MFGRRHSAIAPMDTRNTEALPNEGEGLCVRGARGKIMECYQVPRRVCEPAITAVPANRSISSFSRTQRPFTCRTVQAKS
jgi:hypothetical protein